MKYEFMNKEPLLEIKDLKVKFPDRKRILTAVDGVNLQIRPGEIVGVVGESGSGKSVMSQSILSKAPWAVIFPGLAVVLCVLSLNLLGDGLRDYLDPRTAGRKKK